jgi:hypothetical protein
VPLVLLCVVLLAGGTVFIMFSWHRLQGSDDAELIGWFVLISLGLSAAAAFLLESVLFPKSANRGESLRFVILHHEGVDDPHFDIMLETSPASSLATWRSPVWPITEPTSLEQLADHRPDYLEFEGEISGGRGRVRRIESGTCHLLQDAGGGKLIEWEKSDSRSLVFLRIDRQRWSAIPK